MARPGGLWPSFREARAPTFAALRTRGWVWRLSMLWVVLGACGALYCFVGATVGCTTNLCTDEEFLYLLWNGEPAVIADVSGLAAVVWVLLTLPLLVSGFARLRAWRPRNWRQAAAWTGAWIAGCALMILANVVGSWGSHFRSVVFGALALPIFATWLALGAGINRILSAPAHSRDVPDTSGRSSRQASW
ncbi:MAG: hypothetical protein LBV34_23745 [Nocardiopsaceae bacterium]|jgi:hypothetical protein|nr:hypothetical protein [Nocardiopsaceae bacterium]